MLRTTLRQLEVFVATAQKASVTQAAAAIGVTQSAASMALADFERQLGTRLFDRIGKRLALNEDGRMLYPQAVEMVERAQAMEGLFTSAGRAVNLRLGASTTIGNYLLPSVIGRLHAERPGSRIGMDVGNTRQVIGALLNFEIDVGFVEGPCLHPDIEATFWQDDALAVCARPDDPLARQVYDSGGARMEALRQARWILREPGSGTREVVEQLLTSQLGDIRLAMALGGTEAIKRAVESGIGISCLSRTALAGEIERGKLVALDTPGLTLTRSLHIVLHRQKYRTEGIEALLALCRTPA
jgi:DNA-binding transcriptional LysR family regulator